MIPALLDRPLFLVEFWRWLPEAVWHLPCSPLRKASSLWEVAEQLPGVKIDDVWGAVEPAMSSFIIRSQAWGSCNGQATSSDRRSGNQSWWDHSKVTIIIMCPVDFLTWFTTLQISAKKGNAQPTPLDDPIYCTMAAKKILTLHFFYFLRVIRHNMYIQSKFIIPNGNKSIQKSTNRYFVMFPFPFKTFSILRGIDSAKFSK